MNDYGDGTLLGGDGTLTGGGELLGDQDGILVYQGNLTGRSRQPGTRRRSEYQRAPRRAREGGPGTVSSIGMGSIGIENGQLDGDGLVTGSRLGHTTFGKRQRLPGSSPTAKPKPSRAYDDYREKFKAGRMRLKGTNGGEV